MMTQNKKESYSDPCAEVIPGLWIGSLASLKSIDNDIKVQRRWHVISVLGNEKLISLSKIFISSSTTLIGCDHEIWRLSDSFQADFLSETLISILRRIDDTTSSLSTSDSSSIEKVACLVHCAQGVSRSAAVCAAWLISRKKMSVNEALAQIRRVRSEVSPNLGFLASLRALEKCDGDVRKAMLRIQGK